MQMLEEFEARIDRFNALIQGVLGRRLYMGRTKAEAVNADE